MSSRRILAVITALALVVAVMPLTAGAEGTFSDDDGNIHESAIEKIAALGITKGCNPPTNDLYCPSDEVTRGQMAAFLVRAFNLTETGTAAFTDDDDSIFEGDIERLAHAGITRGCNPPDNTLFCPDDPVTRGQMAAFLVRALGLTESGTAAFTDDDTSIFEGDIEILAHAGITRGCNPPVNDHFCPDEPVLRDQMATFLSRAYDIFTTGTTTTTTSTSSTSSTSSSSSTSSTSTSSTTTTMPAADPWSDAPTDMPVGLVSAGHTNFGTDLYIAGGKTGADPGDRVSTFQRYDMQNDEWETLLDVPGTPREDIALVEHGGLIYAFGGATTTFNAGDSQVAAAYDPTTDTWDDTGVLDLAAGLTSAQAVSWKGEIWIIGGFNSTGASLSQVLIYDPVLNSYDPGPALPAPRDNAGVAIQDGGTAVDELYVIGGRNAQGSSPLTKVNSWVLNATDDDWDDIAPLPVARRSFVVATVDNKIQVFGGENDGGTAGLGQVDEYDPATNTWTTLTGFDWPSPRHGAAGAQAEVGGETIVFMAGGATLAGAASTTAANDSFNRALATP